MASSNCGDGPRYIVDHAYAGWSGWARSEYEGSGERGENWYRCLRRFGVVAPREPPLVLSVSLAAEEVDDAHRADRRHDDNEDSDAKCDEKTCKNT